MFNNCLAKSPSYSDLADKNILTNNVFRGEAYMYTGKIDSSRRVIWTIDGGHRKLCAQHLEISCVAVWDIFSYSHNNFETQENLLLRLYLF